MQAPLPFPDSMLFLHPVVLCSPSATVDTDVPLFQHAVADRGKALHRVAGSGGRGRDGEMCHKDIVDLFKAWERT
jgi:hypothetical protein